MRIFFTRIRSTEGSSADCSLFILSLHALALHLAVKILSNLSVWRFEHVGLTYICRLYFLQNVRMYFCYATNTIKWNIPNIWHNHQQNTRRSDQIETIKTIMQTTRLVVTWKVLPMAQVAIFKENDWSSAERFRLWIVLFWTKTSQRLHYIYYLATDNIHIVLENDNTVLIKGLKKV